MANLEELYEPTPEELAGKTEDPFPDDVLPKPEPKPKEPLQPQPEPAKSAAPNEPAAETPDEAYARTRGWVPKEEWKAAPHMWKPASEWLQNGESMAQLKHQVSHLQKLFVDRERSERERQEKAITDAKASWEAELREGRREFDFDRVEAAEAQIKRLEESEKALANQPVQPVPQGTRPGFDAWQAANPWYNQQTDPATWVAATEYGKFLEHAMGVQYDQALLMVSEKFAPKAVSAPPSSSPVEAPRGGPSRAGGNGVGRWSDLTEDARKDFNMAVRYGVYRNTDADRAAYAKEVLGR